VAQLTIAVEPIVESQVVHMELAQVFDLPESLAIDGPWKNEVHVDEVVTNPVHAREPNCRHEGHAGLRRGDFEWAALLDQSNKAPEEVAADLGLTLEELFNRVWATGVRHVLGNQLRATAGAFPELGGASARDLPLAL
jgi:hypothetical protein